MRTRSLCALVPWRIRLRRGCRLGQPPAVPSSTCKTIHPFHPSNAKHGACARTDRPSLLVLGTGAAVGAVSPVLARMWAGCAQSWRGCGRQGVSTNRLGLLALGHADRLAVERDERVRAQRDRHHAEPRVRRDRVVLCAHAIVSAQPCAAYDASTHGGAGGSFAALCASAAAIGRAGGSG